MVPTQALPKREKHVVGATLQRNSEEAKNKKKTTSPGRKFCTNLS